MFDWKKPTVEMLGRWQPWHDGHTELFKRALQKTGQVCIMYRDVGGADAGVEGQSDNPFLFEEVKKNIKEGRVVSAKLNQLNKINNLPFDAKSLSKSKQFDDTTKMFEEPKNVNQHVTSFLTDDEIKLLAEKIKNV